MPRVTIPVTKLSDAGVADPAETNGDTVNGNTVPNTGKTLLRIRNAHATLPQTVTFVTPVTTGGKAVSDNPIAIPATETRTFGDFNPSVYSSNLPIDVSSADLKLIAYEP